MNGCACAVVGKELQGSRRVKAVPLLHGFLARTGQAEQQRLKSSGKGGTLERRVDGHEHPRAVQFVIRFHFRQSQPADQSPHAHAHQRHGLVRLIEVTNASKNRLGQCGLCSTVSLPSKKSKKNTSMQEQGIKHRAEVGTLRKRRNV